MADNEERPQPSVAERVQDLFGGESDASLVSMVDEYTKAQDEKSKAEKKCEDLKARIMQKLDEIGTTSIKVAGRRVGITTRRYYGVNKERLAEFQKWMQDNAPEANIPAAANVGKAVEAYVENHPGEALPECVTFSDTRILTNAKA